MQESIAEKPFKISKKDQILKDSHTFWIDKGSLLEVDIAIKSMYSNQEEVLVEVDAKDKEIGSIVKREAHSGSGRFHRAAHIVVFTSKGEVVLHQRSHKKAMAPSKWDMFGGHQVYGQTIEQTAVAELSEELGVTPPLKFVRKGLHKSSKQNEYFYLYYGIDDGPYGFDKNEVEQIKRFDCEKLLNREYDAEYDVLEHVYTYVAELSHVW